MGLASRSVARRLAGYALAGGMLALLPPVAPALAGNCGVEEQVFVRSTAARGNTKGTWNEIVMRDRDLESACTAMDFCGLKRPGFDGGSRAWKGRGHDQTEAVPT